MNSRKIRTYPPIIVSVIAAAICVVGAIGTINSTATMRVTANTQQEQTIAAQTEKTTIAQTTVAAETEQPTEVTYESLIMSRDWSAEESQMLMKIAMAEAEGESVEGKALVMLVVLNRVWSDDFPDTIEEVIFQPKQFSPVTEGGRYYTTEPNEECYEALGLVMSGWDESRGALYFESCERSSWHSENLEYLYQVGNHKFYR